MGDEHEKHERGLKIERLEKALRETERRAEEAEALRDEYKRQTQDAIAGELRALHQAGDHWEKQVAAERQLAEVREKSDRWKAASTELPVPAKR